MCLTQSTVFFLYASAQKRQLAVPPSAVVVWSPFTIRGIAGLPLVLPTTSGIIPVLQFRSFCSASPITSRLCRLEGRLPIILVLVLLPTFDFPILAGLD